VFTWQTTAQYPLFTSSERKVTSTTPLVLNTWYHVALTYKNGLMALYVNGVQVASGTNQLGPIKPSSGQEILIGGKDFFKGMIDDTKIYSRCLPASQILQDYIDTKDGLSNTATLTIETTRGGWSYSLQVTPNDGKVDGATKTSNALSLPNTLPVASDAGIIPRAQLGALDTEALNAVYTYTDADGQTESGSQIRWYKNGALQSALNNQKVVAASLTTVGDKWYYTVTPSDGVGLGAMVTSYTIPIRNNAVPTQGTPQLTTSAGSKTTSTLTTTASTTDSNGDPTTNVFKWMVNGVSINRLILPFDTYSATNTHDYSGYNTDANIAVTGAKWAPNGISGGYLNFDGNDYVRVYEDSDLNPGTWTQLTVEFWVKPSVDQMGSRIIKKGYAADSVGSYVVGINSNTPSPSNTIYFDVQTGTSTKSMTNETYSDGATTVPTGRWSHVVCTYQSGVGMAIYINGTLRSSLAGVTGRIFDWGSQYIEHMWIGYDGYGNANRFFKGGLDEVRIYNRALSASQIQQRFLEGKNSIKTTSKMMPSELKAGDIWSCQVTPSDGFGNGAAATSNSVTLTQG
jgi:hypothetical protein